jgi:hypothetical protein
MANKMFYTAEEAAEKLKKSVTDVLEMAKRGEIQEFRDRDKVMFKVEQVNLLAGEDDGDLPLALEDSRMDDSAIDLADSTGGRNAAASQRPAGKPPAGGRAGGPSGGQPGNRKQDLLADSREETGISAFDASRYGQDKSGSKAGGPGSRAGSGELSLETVGSGSGLLDLTRENDDSLSGAALIEDAFSNDDDVNLPANASGLFDAAGAESGGNVIAAPMGGMTMMPMMVESYDGAWSGLGVGLLIGAFASLVMTMIIGVVMATGTVPALATIFTGSMLLWAGGLLGLTLICGVVGFLIGRATE